MLTKKQLAGLLKVSTRTITNREKAGVFRSVKLGTSKQARVVYHDDAADLFGESDERRLQAFAAEMRHVLALDNQPDDAADNQPEAASAWERVICESSVWALFHSALELHFGESIGTYEHDVVNRLESLSKQDIDGFNFILRCLQARFGQSGAVPQYVGPWR